MGNRIKLQNVFIFQIFNNITQHQHADKADIWAIE